jgi:integral membrane protein (TIGR01906 family)
VNSPWYVKLFSWVVTLAVPVALVLTTVRLLLSPVFINIEYNVPGFPADPFGFTREDRLYWANIARLYLLNDAGIEYLADLRFPDGGVAPPQTCRTMDDCTRLYNDRELQHMLDVKNVVQAALKVWIGSLLVLVGLGVWAWFGGWFPQYKFGLGRGGWLTVILIAGILAFVLFAFGIIFVAFHNVFFEAGTWQFLFSDTLIRLFPERFWRDIFLAVGLISGGAGLLMGYLFRGKLSSLNLL